MPPARARRPRLAAADVDVDAFLAGAFEDVDTASPSSRRAPPHKRRAAADAAPAGGGRNAARGSPSSSDASDDDVPALKHKKAKRGAAGAADGETGRRAPKRGASAAATHRAELDALAAKDPEFYAYLQAADADLLEFEGGDESDGASDGTTSSDDGQVEDAPPPRRLAAPVSPLSSSDEDESDEDQPPSAAAPSTPPARAPASARPPPPPALLAQWCAEAKATPSLRTVRRLLQAYRAAAHHGDPGAGDDGGDDGGADGAAAAAALARAPASAFNALVVAVLTHGDGMLRSLLGQDKTVEAGTRRPDPRRLPRWRKVEPLARAYLGNTLHLLTSLADPSMTAFILRRLRPSVDLLVCSERLAKKTLKGALTAYGGADARAAVAGALFVRAYARALPGDGPLDAALKGAYREYVKSAKFMTAATAPRLALQAAALVDLYGGAPPAAAYRHAFAYIRQLAGLVRGAVAGKAKDGHRAVYCWQTVTCLELWARLVGELAPARVPALAPLAFPVLTLLSSAAALVPTPRYHPLHLRLHRAAAGLAAATGAYVPLTAPLLDMLAWKGLASPPKRGGGGGGRAARGAAPDAFLLRASKADLASPVFQQALVDDVLELTASHLAQWAGSPAFPELSRPAAARLRAFVKSVRVDRFRVAAKGLLAALEATAAGVASDRADGATAPSDGDAVAAFTAARADRSATPLGRHADALAAAARERRELAAAAAVKYGDGGSRRERRAGRQEEEDESGSDDDAPQQPTAAPRRRKPPPAPVSVAAGWADDADAGDVLMPYVESDSD